MKIACAVFIGLMVFWFCSPASSEIYYWTDKSGVKHFTNIAPETGQSHGTFQEIPHNSATDQVQTEQNANAAEQFSKEAADQAAARDSAADAAARKALDRRIKNLKDAQRNLETEMYNKRNYFKREDGRNRLIRVNRINQQLDALRAQGGHAARAASLEARKRELMEALYLDRVYFRGGGEALLIKWQSLEIQLQSLEKQAEPKGP